MKREIIIESERCRSEILAQYHERRSDGDDDSGDLHGIKLAQSPINGLMALWLALSHELEATTLHDAISRAGESKTRREIE